MRGGLKRKNFYLRQDSVRRAKKLLGARTETEAVQKALDLLVFQEEALAALRRHAGKGKEIVDLYGHLDEEG